MGGSVPSPWGLVPIDDQKSAVPAAAIGARYIGPMKTAPTKPLLCKEFLQTHVNGFLDSDRHVHLKAGMPASSKGLYEAYRIAVLKTEGSQPADDGLISGGGGQLPFRAQHGCAELKKTII